MDKRVILTPSIPIAGEKLKINYAGYLAENPDNTIFVHVGYTDNTTNWTDVTNVQMYKNSNNDFEAIIPLKPKTKLNFTFYDAADHWDNNSGSDYTYDIKIRPEW